VQVVDFIRAHFQKLTFHTVARCTTAVDFPECPSTTGRVRDEPVTVDRSPGPTIALERTPDMRKIIAALIVSVDGFIEGPHGELDWVDTWEDPFDLLP
jgi:hypothetical protein